MTSRLGPGLTPFEDPAETVQRITVFLDNYTKGIGTRHLIVGMSGGLDSSVTAAICSRAVGKGNTFGFFLHESETLNAKSLKDAQEVAKMFGIRMKSLDITGLTRTASALLRPSTRENQIVWGNVKARLRAVILYYFANRHKGLVVGTGDKSEIMLGYFTKYGDGACDLQPLADIYKTSLRQLARHLKLPRRIYTKPASPELWPGQTAEEELGLAYEKLDPILWGLERWMTPADISRDLSIPIKMVERVRSRWLRSEHKRRPPLALKLGFRTAGQDLRLPYSM